MNTKGQGALEYLLLIGGAILVAAIVIALIVGLPSAAGNPADKTLCVNQANFVSCGAADPSGGVCCPLKTDGGAAATQGEYGYCAWATTCS